MSDKAGRIHTQSNGPISGSARVRGEARGGDGANAKESKHSSRDNGVEPSNKRKEMTANELHNIKKIIM